MCKCFFHRSLYHFLSNNLYVRRPLPSIISFVDLRSRVGDDEVVVQSVDSRCCEVRLFDFVFVRVMSLIISGAFSNHQQSSRLK
jgi:hypothetical protein